METYDGIIELTEHEIQFFANQKKHFKWYVREIREVYRRYFLLRNTALELFFSDNTSVFFDLPPNETMRLLSKLLSINPPQLINCASVPPSRLLSRSKLTKRWQERSISNFEYLMILNTIAGRSYNDLNQYPVFPWILVDYESATIDLTNPKVYRDLTKPIGALSEERLQQALERYTYFDDPAVSGGGGREKEREREREREREIKRKRERGYLKKEANDK
jgi:hypothetical protein